jgi:hypothetical protein
VDLVVRPRHRRDARRVRPRRQLASLAALLHAGAVHGSAACACTDTGGVRSFSIWFVRVRRPAAHRAIREAVRWHHHPRQPPRQLLRSDEKDGASVGGTWHASTRAPRPSLPQGGSRAPAASGSEEVVGNGSAPARRLLRRRGLVDYRQVT